MDTAIPTSSSSNNGLNNSGAVYIYRSSGGVWGVDAMIKAPNSYAGAKLSSVALNTDGSLLVAGSSQEKSFDDGFNPSVPTPSEMDTYNSSGGSKIGAAYIYKYDLSWSFEYFLKNVDSRNSDWFGDGVRTSGSGNVITISSPLDEASNSGVQNSGVILVY